MIWGDTDIAPSSDEWFGGRTITLQGAAICSAADKLRKDLLGRAANVLEVDAAKLQIRDGVISSTEDPANKTTFAALVKGEPRRHPPNRPRRFRVAREEDRTRASAPALPKWKWTPGPAIGVSSARYIRTTPAWSSIRWWPRPTWSGRWWKALKSRPTRFRGIANFRARSHYSVGYLSYRLPTIMDVPQQTQLYIDSLEPRWFYGVKSFSETSIGAVPGAIANAIYNACGVRIREHPITREKIMAGLRTKARRA